MFGLTRFATAIIATAFTTAGTGTVLATSISPPAHVDAGAELSAKASAELAAASDLQRQATEALASTDALVQAKASALIATSASKLDDASASMKAAVDAGSKTAVSGIADFTTQITKLVNDLTVTTGATVNASVQTGAHLVSAVDTQLAAARAVLTAEGQAAVKALNDIKLSLPPVTLPSASVNSQVSADVAANGSVPAPPASADANLVGSLTGSLGLGR